MGSKVDRAGRKSLVFAVALGASLVTAPDLHASNCTGTSVGLIPIEDLGAGTYQGYQAGLYPGGVNVRPATHDAAANTFARVFLLDPNGVPNASTGRAILLSIGMSNTTQEFSRFRQVEATDPNRNHAVLIVDGAQGGWTATRVSDPNQNGPFWATVDQRIAAAGGTGAQVEAVWLKEAESNPTQAFPSDAQILMGHNEEILRILKTRYPNVRQVYVSSRIYAGYASTTLNPEPYAYQSAFAVKWTIGRQIAGEPSLNFDPREGPVVAPWTAWGPYPWADGLTPRSDGLTWACSELEADGTHPGPAAENKVAGMLNALMHSDPIAKRWFSDCDGGDPSVFSAPPDVLNVYVEGSPGNLQVRWQSLGPLAGRLTVHDVVYGSLRDLRTTRSFAGAVCGAASVPNPPIADPAPDPAPGDGVYYLVRGRNACGDGTYGEDTAPPTSRVALDAASPCP